MTGWKYKILCVMWHGLFLCPLLADKAVDLSVLEHAALWRADAYQKSRVDDKVGTQDLLRKSEGYASTLRTLLLQLRKAYYLHPEFPADPCAAIDDFAKMVVGQEYPLSAHTGASGYEWQLVDMKIRLLEESVCRMSRNIFDAAHRDPATYRPNKQASIAYDAWLRKWSGASAREH